MCVILYAEDVRPSADMVSKAWEKNQHGGGFAYRGFNDKNEPVVIWEKGLTLTQIQKYVAETPLPFVAHFRIASIGPVCDELTHPYPVHAFTPQQLKGKIKGQVLFHNGHWAGWKARVEEAIFRGGYKIPGGKWNDSRAMAWIAGNMGTGMLDFIDEKVIIFGRDDKETEIYGSGWKLIEGVSCSNDLFWNRGYTYVGDHRSQHNRGQVYHPTSGTGTTPPSTASTDVPPLRAHEITKNGELIVRHGTPGGGSTVVPFPNGVPKDLSLAQLEALNKSGQLSKNKLKKARRYFQKAESRAVKLLPAPTAKLLD